MTAFQLGLLASYYNWTTDQLRLLFGWGDEPASPEDGLETLISRAISRGEEPDWIEEVLCARREAYSRP